MKKLLAFIALILCLQLNCEAQPKIRIKQTSMENRQGFFPLNTEFKKGKRYYSEENQYYLIFQEDGNLVVYKAKGPGGNAIWSSNTMGVAMKKCVFQQDGNLVLYDYNNQPRWNAFSDDDRKKDRGQFQKFTPRYMVIQSDGNLVLYSAAYPATDVLRWASDSGEKN